MIISLPANKKQDIYITCIVLLSTSSISIRAFASFVGTLVASLYGPLFYRHLEGDKLPALNLNNGNFDACLTLSERSKSGIAWWKDNVMVSPKCIVQRDFTHALNTDASLEGWGGGQCSMILALVVDGLRMRNLCT